MRRHLAGETEEAKRDLARLKEVYSYVLFLSNYLHTCYYNFISHNFSVNLSFYNLSLTAVVVVVVVVVV